MRNRTRGPRVSTNTRPDRRIGKTQRALHEALVALIRERDYDEISVQAILDRANVGRSTFYTHYRDKDELLVSGIHEMIRSVSSSGPATASTRDRLTWFSLPILTHHEQHRRDFTGQLSPDARALLHEHLRRALTSILRERFKKSPPRREGAAHIPTDLLAPYIASTFVLVLNWWLDSRNSLGSADVHRVFESLIASAITS